MNKKIKFQKELLLKEERIKFWEDHHQLMPKTEEIFFETIYKNKLGSI